MTRKITYAGIVLSILALGAYFAWTSSLPFIASGAITTERPAITPQQGGTLRSYTFFTGTTTTAVSTNVNSSNTAYGVDYGYLVTAGAKKVNFYFQRGDTTGTGNSGKSVFDVDVSPDGTNWYDFNTLLANDVSRTATTSVTINAATSTVIYSMDLVNNNFWAVRCSVTETTDGEHTCKAEAEY